MAEHDAPDLQQVKEEIQRAHAAEDSLMHTMPNAIQPHDDAYEGMSGASEGDVQEVDDRKRTDDERQAESPQRTPTEQVEDDVVEGAAPPQNDRDGGGERRDDVDEAAVEGTVVEDESAPPRDPDHR